MIVIDHPADSSLDGEHETSTEIYSVKPNPTLNPKQVHQETRSELNDTPVTCHSKYSAVNPVHTSSIPNSRIIKISTTGPRPCGTICPVRKNNRLGTQRRNVWILRKCGSVGIYGRMLRKMD